MPLSTKMSKVELRRKYQRRCPYDLYGTMCGINKDYWNVTGDLGTVDGYTWTASEFSAKPNGWFNGGFIVVGRIKRLITSHTGSTITVLNKALNVVAGNHFVAYAGCKHSTADCDTKFSNLINYGGQPYIPNINPFAGDGLQ